MAAGKFIYLFIYLFKMTMDSWIRAQYLKQLSGRIFYFFSLVFVSRDFEVGSK